MRSKNAIAWIAAIIAVLVWGETFISSKLLLNNGLRPADIFFFRFSLAYAGMWVICALRKAKGPAGGRASARLCPKADDEVRMLLLGITGGSLYFLLENTALRYSTASNVAIIISATPLATAIIVAIFHKEERLTRRQLLGSLISIAGLSLIVFNGEVILKLNPLGDLLTFGAVICWGVYSLLIKEMSERYDIAFITRKVFGYGLLTIIPYFLLFGWPQLSAHVYYQPIVWGNLLYLSLVASLFCFLAWNWAMSRIGAVKITNLIYLQPFFAMIIGSIVLGEHITWMAIAGAVILISGLAIL